MDVYSGGNSIYSDIEECPKEKTHRVRKTMSVHEMRDLLGLKKTESYWLVHKNFFETKMVGGKMRVDIASFEKWYANQVKHRKVNGEEPGRELIEKSYSFREAANLLGISSYILYEIWKREGRKYIVIDFTMRIPKEEFELWYGGQNVYQKEDDIPTLEDMKKKYVPIEEAAKRLNIPLEEMKAMTLTRTKKPIFELRRFNDRKWISKRSLKLYINMKMAEEVSRAEEKATSTPAPIADTRICITRQEAADLAGVAPSTITKWVQAGKFPGKRTRSVLSIPRKEFMEWLDKTEKGEC